MMGDNRPSDLTKKLTQRLDLDFALQAAGLGVWELDPETNQVLLDDRCRELFGIIRENDLTYEQAFHYIHPEDKERINEAVQRALSPDSDRLYDEVYRTIGADNGQLRWVRFYGRSYFSENGELERFAGVALDVTEQIQIQQQEEATRLAAQRQQRIYEAITSSTPDLIYVFDLNYRFIYVNQALLEMWGSTLENALGKGLLDNGYEPWHARMHEQEIDQVVATKQPIRGVVSFPHAKLGKRIYDYLFAPVLNDLGDVEAIAGTTRDITDRQQVDETVRRSETNFRTLFESMQEGYTVCEGIRNQAGELIDYRFLQVNPAFCRLTGLRAEDTLGRTAREVLPGLEPKWYTLYQEVLDTRQPVRREDFVPPLNEWYSLTAFWFADNQFAVLFDEITERKRSEEALKQSEERYRHLNGELEERVKLRTAALSQVNTDLKRSNENLQQFAYVASHDLQEPLRKIQSFSTLLAQNPDELLNPAAGDYLQRITAASVRMSTLIRDLLAYSRIATRQQEFGLISLQTIVNDVLTTLEWEISESGAQIRTDALPMVNGDASQLGQLFQNLVSNALKFVRPGQVPEIRIMYSRCPAEELPADVHPTVSVNYYHLISVTDQGIGFDDKYRDRIFQVFQRLHGKSEYAGSGVGLAICQRVAENHGGAITVVSQPGNGASFRIYLPVVEK